MEMQRRNKSIEMWRKIRGMKIEGATPRIVYTGVVAPKRDTIFKGGE
jgi:hypothetical protein